MRTMNLVLDYKLSEQLKKAGTKAEVITLNYLVEARKALYAGGQSLEQAKLWGRILDDCYDKNGVAIKELELSEERFDEVKRIVKDGKVPAGQELVALRVAEELDKIDAQKVEEEKK